MRSQLHELAAGDPKDDEPWLGSVPDELVRLTGQWDRDIIAPTSGLSDLMYKSVGIRDARHSLQLGLSMWRLSWITFIFLPLTFTVGFFGMNVDTFSDNVSIKWWFIVSIPILVLVLALWYAVKHTLSTQRQNPLRRGVYEALYHELATEHSALWTRRGPRPNVVPVGWWNGLKWRLVTTWFGSDKLKAGAKVDPATEEFGAWSRIKQRLVRRWLVDLPVMSATELPLTTQPGDNTPISRRSSVQKELSAFGQLVSIATPVAMAELDPTAASQLRTSSVTKRVTSLSPTRSDAGSGGRTSSEGRTSGLMVEEKGGSEDERSGDEGGGTRLDVPLQ
jgi:hypothetical protein